MRKLAAVRAALLVRSLSAKTNKTNELAAVRSCAPLCHRLALSGARTHHLAVGALGWMVAASLTGPALAADLSAAPSRPAPAVPYAFSWAGSYLGVNLGGAWSSLDLQATSLGSGSF